MITPKKIKHLYGNGVNISELLRKDLNIFFNTEEIIEISYDIQTGSYIEAMSNNNYRYKKDQYAKTLAKIILDLCKPKSILEAGVGEGTTFGGGSK